MKTIAEWYDELPDGYKERAKVNLNMYPLIVNTSKTNNLGYAVLQGFHWGPTEEGYKFWDDVYHHLMDGSALPPLPLPEGKEIENEDTNIL